MTRFTEFLDPTHLQPWHFYWTSLWARAARRAHHVARGRRRCHARRADGPPAVGRRGHRPAVALPAARAHFDSARRSCTTTRIRSCRRVGLAVGYLCGLLLALGPVVARAPHARRVELVRPVQQPIDAHVAAADSAAVGGGVAVGVAVYSLVFGPLRISIDGREVFRSSGVFRPLVLAVVASLLTGARARAPCPLWSSVAGREPPAAADLSAGPRRPAARRQSPIRAARDCIQRVQAATAGPGHPRGSQVRARLPYPLYYSFRHVRPMVFAESPGPERLAQYLQRSGRPLADPRDRRELSGDSLRAGPRDVRSPGMAVYRDLGKDHGAAPSRACTPSARSRWLPSGPPPGRGEARPWISPRRARVPSGGTGGGAPPPVGDRSTGRRRPPD